MPIVFNNGKLLFTADGKLAMSTDCCCDSCMQTSRTVDIEFRYTLSQSQTTGLPSCSQIPSASTSPAYYFSFTPVNGATEALTSPGELQLSGGDCGTNITPILSISGRTDGESFVVEYTAVLVRRGILAFSFTPQADFHREIESGECQSVLDIAYTSGISVSIDNVQQPSHNPSWQTGSWVYNSPYTGTKRIGG